MNFKNIIGIKSHIYCAFCKTEHCKIINFLKHWHYFHVNTFKKNLMSFCLFDLNRGINFPECILYLFQGTFGHIPVCKLNTKAFTFQLLFPRNCKGHKTNGYWRMDISMYAWATVCPFVFSKCLCSKFICFTFPNSYPINYSKCWWRVMSYHILCVLVI